jgi:hypothetical protein
VQKPWLVVIAGIFFSTLLSIFLATLAQASDNVVWNLNLKDSTQGIAKLRISPSTDDSVITIGICNQGAIKIQNIKVVHGSGWTTIPLEKAVADAAPPTPPTGARPFTVDRPADTKGPILNLADFGAVKPVDVHQVSTNRNYSLVNTVSVSTSTNPSRSYENPPSV